MNTSQTSILSKPTGTEKIPNTTFAYMRARNRRRLYSLVIREFKKSGLKQSDLARRLGKGSDQVCRWLSGPGNLEIDTVSDLLFAINGGEASYTIHYPFDAPARNFTSRAVFAVEDFEGVVAPDDVETRTQNKAEFLVPAAQ